MLRSSMTIFAAVLALASACSHESNAPTAPASPPSAPAAPSAAKGAGEVIATFDGKTFTTGDFLIEVDRMPPRSRTQLTTPERRKQFVDSYVMNELLAERGRKQGYDHDPDIDRQVEDLRRRLIIQRVMKDFQEPPEISDEEVEKYYEANKRLFSGAQVRASHILVKDEALAKKLRAELAADPSKFEELAKANSTDSATAARGGDLGFFGQGRMVADFERAAFSLEPNEISEVVKTPFGYHIIKVVERKEGPEKPFDEVKDRIRVSMLNQRRQEQVTVQFEEMKSNAKVTIDEEVLAKVVIPNAAPPAHGQAPDMGMGGGH